jgi:membrane-associated phospholipid phosphatase
VIAAMALSVIGYWLYPTAPPRFLTELGLDPSSAVTGNEPLLVKPGDALFNPVAAVPSMHVGLSLIFSWSLAFLVRPVWLKAPLFAYPLLMTYIVVASGNHYWIDGLFGAIVAGAAAAIAYGLGRLNPDWAFRRAAPARGTGEMGPAVGTVAA